MRVMLFMLISNMAVGQIFSPPPKPGKRIRDYLTTSLPSWLAASQDECIEITATEDTDLDNNLDNLSSTTTGAFGGGGTGTDQTWTRATTLTTPWQSDEHIVLFTYFKRDAGATGGAVKASSSIHSGYTNICTLPDHSGVGWHYFLRKPGAAIGSDYYTAYYIEGGYRFNAGGTRHVCSGDCPDPGTLVSFGPVHSVSVTNKKQW